MGQSVKVSVIIPVYQVENFLERAVDSVLCQTLKELEILLVDDGSPDGSPQICDAYAKAYPQRVKVIHQENQGLGLARNAGIREAEGEYVAFLDSDDMVEPDMYERMYQKAMEGGYDMVMCDVRILYVEENRTSVVSSYPRKDFDLPDYIANGNNITYSVNKLYRRSIWQEYRYEKMLFEDIALIPSLVTWYPNIGYIREPFYQYYRRANTISTTVKGEMADIVKAFRFFLERSNPVYRQEVVYCAAKQLYWNMTQSRMIFQPDFILLLKEYEQDFRLNRYLLGDKKTRSILDFLDRQVIPGNFICVHLGRPLPEGYLQALEEHFPNANRLEIWKASEIPSNLPSPVQKALDTGRLSFVEEYLSLRLLAENGGIVLTPESQVTLSLNRLRLNPVFFGFEDQEELTTGCFGAVKEHFVIRGLLDTYEEDNIFNKALLPLKDRIRHFLMVHFRLKPNGRKQLLGDEIQVYLPNILAYDMRDGENCCKNLPIAVPEGYQLVKNGVLEMWSARLLENWNLYKNLLKEKPAAVSSAPAAPSPVPYPDRLVEQEIQERVHQVAELYEHSTSWRITRPLRALGRLLGRGGEKK